MRVLLDTHVALWAVEGITLSAPARGAIVEAETLVLSVVTPWELVIKQALGKIEIHRPIADLVRELEREFGARVLDLRLQHVLAVAALPPHHGDPFDRLLVAQAQVEGLAVVTRDETFGRYGVPIILA